MHVQEHECSKAYCTQHTCLWHGFCTFALFLFTEKKRKYKKAHRYPQYHFAPVFFDAFFSGLERKFVSLRSIKQANVSHAVLHAEILSRNLDILFLHSRTVSGISRPLERVVRGISEIVASACNPIIFQNPHQT